MLLQSACKVQNKKWRNGRICHHAVAGIPYCRRTQEGSVVRTSVCRRLREETKGQNKNNPWPTAENLVPIRLDIEIEGQRFKDSFTWNLSDPDSEVVSFAKRTVKDLKLPPTFINQISQSIHSQLAEFRSYEGQEMNIKEKIVPLKLDIRVNSTVIRDQFLWDISNLESDPEEFARTLCKDLDIEDPEVGPAIAVSLREQLFEIAIQCVASARESRLGKKGRRGVESFINSKMGNSSFDLMKLFGSKGSVVRKRKDWYLYEPIVDILSNEEAKALDAREERNARLKKKLDEKEDGFQD